MSAGTAPAARAGRAHRGTRSRSTSLAPGLQQHEPQEHLVFWSIREVTSFMKRLTSS
jgi:hypothetical protein